MKNHTQYLHNLYGRGNVHFSQVFVHFDIFDVNWTVTGVTAAKKFFNKEFKSKCQGHERKFALIKPNINKISKKNLPYNLKVQTTSPKIYQTTKIQFSI